jgi:tRNA A-37 threonylcarbamoyl transferase component Bud32
MLLSHQVLIDFGLAYTTSLAEDKAVDLYVLERAITSAHASLSGLVRTVPRRPRTSSSHFVTRACGYTRQFDHIVDEYKRVSSSWKPTLVKFAEGT